MALSAETILIILLSMGSVMGWCFKWVWEYIQKKWIWPVSIIKRELRGNTTIYDLEDRGRRKYKKKEGTYEFQLKNEKEPIEPVKFEAMGMDKKGKAVIEFFIPNPGDLRPITFSAPNPGLKVEDVAAKVWYVQRLKQNRERYLQIPWYIQYAPYISLATLGMILIVSMIFMAKGYSDLGKEMGQATRAWTSIAESLKKVVPEVKAPGW